MHFIYYLFLILTIGVEDNTEKHNVLNLKSKSDTIWGFYGPDIEITTFLENLADTEDIVYGKLYNGKPRDLMFYTLQDTLQLKYSKEPIPIKILCQEDTTDLVIVYTKKETGTKANYSEKYIRENEGKIIIEIPEVYELANIATAITNYGLNNPWRIYKKTEYYNEVKKHFLPFKNHPLISEIEFSNKGLHAYYGFRDNSVCYILDGDSLKRKNLYPEILSLNPFKKNLKLVEDFAKKTEFRKFYKENIPYYQSLIVEYREKIPLKKMWRWLEENFSDEYDCYKIIFSPLIYSSHRTIHFEKDGFRECIMFVSGPQTCEEIDSPKIKESILSRVVFTEIDHNYVNPATSKYQSQIYEIFHDFKKWNKQDGYQSTSSTFNEYMTWAVFNLYAYDTYEKDIFEEIQKRVISSMENGRKFVHFSKFNAALLELYKNKDKGEKVEDLYPEILNWTENFNP